MGLSEDEALEEISNLIRREIEGLYDSAYEAIEKSCPAAFNIFMVEYEEADIDCDDLASVYIDHYTSLLGNGNRKSAGSSTNAKARTSNRSSRPKRKSAKVASKSTKPKSKASQPRKANGQFAKKPKSRTSSNRKGVRR